MGLYGGMLGGDAHYQVVFDFLREDPLKHMQAQCPVVGYVLRVLRQGEMEAKVVIWTPAAVSETIKNLNTIPMIATHTHCKDVVEGKKKNVRPHLSVLFR